MPPRVAIDRWKYYDIIHQRHSVMNPVDETRLERLYDLLELKPNARVIDIGCGKGEMLIMASREVRHQRPRNRQVPILRTGS
jgi:cyclopropane fatty-acyl-phospholipid synthase-like methyltransferase